MNKSIKMQNKTNHFKPHVPSTTFELIFAVLFAFTFLVLKYFQLDLLSSQQTIQISRHMQLEKKNQCQNTHAHALLSNR